MGKVSLIDTSEDRYGEWYCSSSEVSDITHDRCAYTTVYLGRDASLYIHMCMHACMYSVRVIVCMYMKIYVSSATNPKPKGLPSHCLLRQTYNPSKRQSHLGAKSSFIPWELSLPTMYYWLVHMYCTCTCMYRIFSNSRMYMQTYLLLPISTLTAPRNIAACLCRLIPINAALEISPQGKGSAAIYMYVHMHTDIIHVYK